VAYYCGDVVLSRGDVLAQWWICGVLSLWRCDGSFMEICWRSSLHVVALYCVGFPFMVKNFITCNRANRRSLRQNYLCYDV
jgi:hypothetical protein